MNDELISSETYINKVFVYGTLMQGLWNHKRYLGGQINRITAGRTYGLLYHLPEGYPALIAGKEAIEGEVIQPVDENLMESLDSLEGYDERSSNNLYVRQVRSISTEDGEEAICWVYVYTDEKYAKENGILVLHGNWKKFIEKKGEFV